MKLRVNALSTNYSMQKPSDLPSKRVREFIGKYEPRQRASNEALPPQITDMVKMYLREYPANRSNTGDTIVVHVLKNAWPCPERRNSRGTTL